MHRGAGTERDVRLGGRYRLLRVVGSGGMGTVWEAEDEVLARRVAVKVLSEALARSDRAVRGFEREARAAARLSGPHVVAVYDFGIDDGTPFIVMELVDGETLADRLARDGRLSSEEAAWIAADVADALEASHRAGVVHRDVKPGNVMLSRSGGVTVMDFGIAAVAWSESLTVSGTVVGTPAYLAPEQASGDPATPKSDLYALGAVLYEMLAGRPPFVRGTPVATALAHVRDEPQPLTEVAPEVSPGVAAACEAALAKDPARRPPSAAALASALRSSTAVPPVEGEDTVRLAPVDPPGRAVPTRLVVLGALLLVAIPLVLRFALSPLPKAFDTGRTPATVEHVSPSLSPSRPAAEEPTAEEPKEPKEPKDEGHGKGPPEGHDSGKGPPD